MTTKVKLGPGDHGRALTWEEYVTGDYQEGFKYEIVDGRLYVSPLPNLPEDALEKWLYSLLHSYTLLHPGVANYVTDKARVFVADREDVTAVEPDLALYRDFPLARRFTDLSWDEVSPLVVAEILSPNDPRKDLERNVELYFQVPSIREFWILDGRRNAAQPALRAHRRHGKQWRVRQLNAGETYTTRLLPDFELLLDPLR